MSDGGTGGRGREYCGGWTADINTKYVAKNAIMGTALGTVAQTAPTDYNTGIRINISQQSTRNMLTAAGEPDWLPFLEELNIFDGDDTDRATELAMRAEIDKLKVPVAAEPCAENSVRLAASNWLAFLEIIRKASTVSITCVTDAEFGNESFFAVVIPNSGRAVHAVREDLGLLVGFLSGKPDKKPCVRCKKLYALSMFSASISSIDGRCRYCHDCERKRNRQDKAKKAAAPTAQARLRPR